MDARNMVNGKKYHVTYRIPISSRSPKKEMVAVAIGVDRNAFREGLSQYHFSGRPEFGTSTLQYDWIIQVEEVAAETKCYADKKVAT
jgi:hypothetical protein